MIPGDALSPCPGGIRRWAWAHRWLAQHPIWTAAPDAWFRVMIGILMRVNFAPNTWFDGKEYVTIPAGSLATSIPHMADYCRVSEMQYRKSLSYLEKIAFVTVERTPRYHLITIRNWDGYRGGFLDENTHENGFGTRSEHDENSKQYLYPPSSSKTDEETKEVEPINEAGFREFKASYERLAAASPTDWGLARSIWTRLDFEQRAAAQGCIQAWQDPQFLPLPQNFLSNRVWMRTRRAVEKRTARERALEEA